MFHLIFEAAVGPIIKAGEVLDDEIEVTHSEGSIATLGQSWNFSLAENLKSLDLKDGPRSGITFGQPKPKPSLKHELSQLGLKGCYLNARTSHLYQTLDLPKLICTKLICTTPWIYHGGQNQ